MVFSDYFVISNIEKLGVEGVEPTRGEIPKGF